MWRAALLLLAASLSVSLARPRFHPLSSDMVNYINKLNTTWKVGSFFFHKFILNFVVWLNLFPVPQAGHNFKNADYSYVQKLCGTMLKGPKLPIMWDSNFKH